MPARDGGRRGVIEVGEGVTHVKPADRVIVCWMPPCDACPSCEAGDGHLCRSGGVPGDLTGERGESWIHRRHGFVVRAGMGTR
ncbi:alcohol dehydrogenase catalytic domain-containing protein [Streptomyces anulatus]